MSGTKNSRAVRWRSGWLVTVAAAVTLWGCHAIVGIEDRGVGGATASGTTEKTSGLTVATTTGDATTSPTTDTSGVVSGTTASTGSGSPYETAVLQDGPVIYLRFEEQSGDVIDWRSSMPLGKVFSYDGATSVPDGPNVQRGVGSAAPALQKAIGFVAGAGREAGGYVHFPASTSLLAFDDKKKFTVELWARLDLGVNEFATPIANSKEEGDGTSDGYLIQVGLFEGVGETLGIRTKTLESYSVALYSGFDVSAFHHYAFTYDGAGAGAMYIDGQLGSCNPVELPACNGDVTLSPAFMSNLTIGGVWTSDGNPTNAANGDFITGAIDEVAIYDKALLQTQIAAHYAAAFQ